jgi:stress-induced morphogen
MDLAEIERLIESAITDARAEVTQPRGPADDDHLAATVVSPAFEGMSLVERHELVYDALGDRMTDEIHAIELTTDTPAEHDAR